MYAEKENTIYHVGVSGGKDSVGALLYLIYVAKIPPAKIRATACDTENEHPWTYEHINWVSKNVHPVEMIKAEMGFFDLALHKRRFPSTKVRFCTQVLKIFPSRDHIATLQDQGFDVVAVSGVRAEESEDRSKLPEWDSPLSGAIFAVQWRPLIRWTLSDVLALHKKHAVPLNPLYGIGAERVGCFPCIMSKKAEIRNIAIRFPERIAAIREAEQKFETTYGRYSSFFASDKVPYRFRSKRYVSKKTGRLHMVATIDDVVRWSMSGKRARGSYKDQEPILLQGQPERETLCNSGFCE